VFFFLFVIWIVVDACWGGGVVVFYTYFDVFWSVEFEFEVAAVTGDVELLEVEAEGTNNPSFYIFFLAILTPKSRMASNTFSPVLALTYSDVYSYFSANFLMRWILNEVPLGLHHANSLIYFPTVKL